MLQVPSVVYFTCSQSPYNNGQRHHDVALGSTGRVLRGGEILIRGDSGASFVCGSSVSSVEFEVGSLAALDSSLI